MNTGPQDTQAAWWAIQEANPWWRTGRVPDVRKAPLHRHAFTSIQAALTNANKAGPGRGVVLFGPRGVGKTILLHQLIDAQLASGTAPGNLIFFTLDEPALRGLNLSELLAVLDAHMPALSGQVQYLFLDEIQESPAWSLWLKRLADRRDPYVFFATSSSATALVEGGSDAGVGRWREMTLFPWSFREHVGLRGAPAWSSTVNDKSGAQAPGEAERMDAALVEYLAYGGGFPEAARADDPGEARRHVRQDVLGRVFDRDLVQAGDCDVLRRMFLRICCTPGELWNEVEVARDLGVSRPTVSKYLSALERAFLVLCLPNLASPIKGQPKVHLVAPSLRPTLLGLDANAVAQPEEWARLVENLVVATAMGTRPEARQVGFWREGADECGLVVVQDGSSEYIAVDRGDDCAEHGVRRAMKALGSPGSGWVLGRREAPWPRIPHQGCDRMNVLAARWLYYQRASAGGTLRMAVT